MKKNTCHILTALALCTALFAGCAAKTGSTDTVTVRPGQKGLPQEAGAPMMSLGGNASEDVLVESYASETECYDAFFAPGPGETYEKAPENGYFLTRTAPLSTFSASVDTASYTNVRRMIENGYRLQDIPQSAVRPEEFVNYFRYDLQGPADGAVFGVTTQMAPCPWNESHDLLFVGLATKAIDMSERPASNLVFLVDVSGSMDDAGKLPLLVRSFNEMTAHLTQRDTVSIVTYANGVETVLAGASGDDTHAIRAAFDSLTASGGTNGEGGIQRAYELAERYHIEGGINRVILATDGDFNIGVSDPDTLQRLIEGKRASGTYLSVLGFGMGNYRDDMMERLSQYGNGNYAYIDSLLEARRVLVEEMGATLVTVADDVKLQIEFNPAYVSAYRLVGYENRMLDAADFTDDTKDAAEIGAGHQVVALYEIVRTDSEEAIDLRYGTQDGTDAGNAFDSEIAFLKIRCKAPGESASREVTHVIDADVYTDTPDDNFRLASAAAEFALVLSGSAHRGDATLDTVLAHLGTPDAGDEYQIEFSYLVRRLSGR
ncbi:MAG: VWA domain-containing protein [Lachnospiraceae bacterium]|nr:VWA domain-containing protein [Lachnospiraceae bacterium]